VSSGSSTDVLVVGAGPTGLLAALRLVERGLAVEVIEEEWRPAGHSYALALHPGSLQLLDELGLAEELVAQGRPLATVAVFEGAERRASVRVAEPGARFPFVLALPQSVLESVLARRLAERGITVRWSHRLARLEPRADGVLATVHRLEKASTGYAVARTEWTIDREIAFEAAFVVGADGHRSLVRRALGASFAETGASQVFAVFECAAGPETGDEMPVVLDEKTVSALWPLPGGRARWSLEIEAPEVSVEERFKSRLTTTVGEQLFHHLDPVRAHELVRERAPWFGPAPLEIGWSIEVRFERRLTASFGRDRVWLAGDAAHLTGPVGMQSLNAGLREAGDLASRVADVRQGKVGAGVLEVYGQERMAEWRFLLGQGGGLRPRAGAAPLVARNAGRLLPCLPATGDDLRWLAGQLGLDVDR
jgi:2-polyprenyl-6-methoxyphenol hydroxylase-like FAD-dependent oxidoreductase